MRVPLLCLYISLVNTVIYFLLTVIYVFYNKCDVLALVYANTEFLANSLSYLYRACVLRWLKGFLIVLILLKRSGMGTKKYF